MAFSWSTAALAIRSAQLLFAFILLGLTAYVVRWYNEDTMTASPSQFNWPLAASVISIVSALYLELAPRFAPKATQPLASFGLEAVNALFHFSAFVALAVFMSRLLFCRGSVCSSAQASVAFGAVEFLLWTASAAIAAREAFRGGLSFRRRPGSAPEMAQASP
ncbi:membrane-associating domain-containing protein [Durotheca rogersii]|uniref:membrane-associating domain-containing protein n=1 Tax=Durotheca rogersii TaxID=419775 RepID=UPI00221E9859|nr:membrane-associating domain-containing protein [Durotheca rogersii]KAI5863409.1 membrane-associating domain-containing protein [Durotheca rogersii]